MAKVYKNIVTQGLSGKLGDQIVFRTSKGGQTIVAVKPVYTEHDFNESQLAQQQAFRNAIAYAKSAKDETVYIDKARGKDISSFNAAVSDWFIEPQVLEIDASAWTGQVGQVIRVKAQDDTFVAGVRVAIGDGNGNTFEAGEAVRADGLWWEYTAAAQVFTEDPVVVTATVEDLPGNTHQLSWQNN